MSNSLLMSSAIVSVCSAGLFWLKPVVLGCLCCVCRVVVLKVMLCCDVWNIVCGVW